MSRLAGAMMGLSRQDLEDELTALLDGARHEARFIVTEACDVECEPDPRAPWLSTATAESARAMARRRAAGEPLQYVFGHWPFRAVELLVTPDVLIPRPETEQVVGVALDQLRRFGATDPVMVDAGTGSGAIALSLAAESDAGAVWATDVSGRALRVARKNLERVRAAAGDGAGGLRPVTFAEGSWLEPLPGSLRGRVRLVVSNPPYVAESEWMDLPADVRAEPRQALVSEAGSDGTSGLAGVEAVLTQARRWLVAGGATVIELAPHQATAASALARALGYADVHVERDLSGRERALVAHAR